MRGKGGAKLSELEEEKRRILEKSSGERRPHWHGYVLDADPDDVQAALSWDEAAAGGLRLHLSVLGSGEEREERGEGGGGRPTVLFVHGTSVYGLFYADFLFALHRTGFRVVAVDLPGHGLSGGRRGDFTVEQLVGAVRAATDRVLERFGSPVVVAGSSLGGITALYALAGDGRLAGAVLHNAALLGEGDHREIAQPSGLLRLLRPLVPVLAAVLPRARVSVWRYLDRDALFDPTGRLAPHLDHFLVDPLLSDEYTLRAIASQMRALPPRPVEEIEAPVLFVNGSDDSLFGVPLIERVRGRLERSGDRRLAVVSGGTHMILHERTAEVAGLVAGWLDEHFPV
ncbi:MAG: hypothetical protein Kow0069_27160 [Promethearchaeota archaeon]